MTPTPDEVQQTTSALAPIMVGDARRDALLRALGFDKLSEGQRELALAISNQYDLDPMLRHVVMVDGKPYITRDGLLHVAHKSGDFDGIEVDPPTLDADGKYWRTTCRVYRRSFSRPFIYPGRYPATSGNVKYNEEMAIKVAEVMTLRRAFDVSAPVLEERWDGEIEDVSETPAPTSLAERVAQRALAAGASPEQPETGASVANETSAPVVETPAPLAVVLDETEEESEFIAAIVADAEPDDDSTPEEPEEPKVVSPLRAPEPETPQEAMFVAPVEGFGVDPTSALAEFKRWAKDHDTNLIRAVARELFPNLTGFSDLSAQQLGILQHEVLKSEARSEEAAATERCAAPSPLSGSRCTLDPGHKGVHRHGLRETWDAE